MFIKNCWYVIAWSHEVPQIQENGHIFSRTVLGEPIVVYRSAAGLVAMVDRCCHRGAPLSKGRLEGDELRCGYHGLLFNSKGVCVQVPGMASPPAKACVKTFPVVEKNKWIFVWMGEPEKADEQFLPDNFSSGNPDWQNVPGYMHYDVNYLLICDNLLDFSHLSYVHEKTLGGSTAIAQSRAEVDNVDADGQRGLRIRRQVNGVPPPPSYQRIRQFSGLIDRWWDYDFVIPGTLLMKSGGYLSGTDAGLEKGTEGGVYLHSCQTLTPETENSTHYFFQQGHRTGEGDSELADAMYQMLVRAFLEDKDMIGAQSEVLKLAPNFQMLPLHLDSALTRFRRMIELECAKEIDTVTT
jgi:phenylpropionate dioxygenase-like ring-hydroxylating dioxygenase large terminal subunit